MKRIPPTLSMDIPVPLPVFLELCEHREKTGCRQEISELAGLAIRAWLATRANEGGSCRNASAMSGYQWKELFLPAGTMLRTAFKGRNFNATVEGDCIIFNGDAVSPSEFVNAPGGVGRNAWRVLWLLFPDDSAWKLASTCREKWLK
jgi:hypothetical protein